MTDDSNRQIHVQLESMSFSPLPLGSRERHTWKLTVDYRGDDRFAVRRGPYCLSRSTGDWDSEHIPSERRDDWLADHRFTYEEATAEAMRLCSDVTVNGMTAAKAADILAERSTAGGA